MHYIFRTTPRAPCFPALDRCLWTRQNLFFASFPSLEALQNITAKPKQKCLLIDYRSRSTATAKSLAKLTSSVITCELVLTIVRDRWKENKNYLIFLLIHFDFEAFYHKQTHDRMQIDNYYSIKF